MEPKAKTNFLSLSLEVQHLIFENLFPQEETLHLPEPERKTIAAVCASNKTVRANLTAYEADRPQLLRSVAERYTTCAFTVSPHVKANLPSKGDWDNIQHLVITIDDQALEEAYNLALEKSHIGYQALDLEPVRRQVTEMRDDLEKFVSWVKELPKALQSVEIRFTRDWQEADVLAAIYSGPTGSDIYSIPMIEPLLLPLLELPACRNTVVKQVAEKGGRCTDDDFEDDDELEFVGGSLVATYKYAVQGWIKGWRAEEEQDFQAIMVFLADYELEMEEQENLGMATALHGDVRAYRVQTGLATFVAMVRIS